MAEREMETKVCKFKVKASHSQNIKSHESNKEKYQKVRLRKSEIHAAVLTSQKLRKKMSWKTQNFLNITLEFIHSFISIQP